MKNKSLLFASLFSIVFSLSSFAAWTDIDASEFSMKPPPKQGSAAYKKDFDQLLDEQANRSDADCELAQSMETPSFDTFFVQTRLLTASEAKKSRELVTAAMKLTADISGVFKGKYTRVRPYDADQRIKPCAKKPGGQRSYPSSHASMAVAGACVLGMIFPAKAEKLAERAEHFADLRHIVGVHHPSDVEAGKKIGQEVCDRIAEEKDFQEELDEIKN